MTAWLGIDNQLRYAVVSGVAVATLGMADRRLPRHPGRGGNRRPARWRTELGLDCDMLAVPGDDQVLIAYSAAPGSPDASAVALLRVIGVEPVSATPGRHA